MIARLSPFSVIVLFLSFSMPSFAEVKCSLSYVDSLAGEVKMMDAKISGINVRLDRLDKQMKRLGVEISRMKGSNDKTGGILKDMQLARLLQRSRSISEEMNVLRTRRNDLSDSRKLLMEQSNRCIRKLVIASWEQMLRLVRSDEYAKARGEMERIRTLEGQASSPEDSVGTVEYPSISEDLLKEEPYPYDDKLLILDMIHDLIDKAAGDSTRIFKRLSEVDESIKLKRELLDIMIESSNTAIDGGAFFSDFDEDELKIEISAMEAKRNKLLDRLNAAREALMYYEEYGWLIEESLKDDHE